MNLPTTNLYVDAIQRLCKWRTVFTGWQLGTRAKGDPEGDAVRDHRELTILLRAEVSALTALMVKKGVFVEEEFMRSLAEEAELLNADYEKKFPGVKAYLHGITMDARAVETMKGWRP